MLSVVNKNIPLIWIKKKLIPSLFINLKDLKEMSAFFGIRLLNLCKVKIPKKKLPIFNEKTYRIAKKNVLPLKNIFKIKIPNPNR